MKWERLADSESVKKTIVSLKKRGIPAEYYVTRNEVMNRIIELIPPYKKVMIGGSASLKEIGPFRIGHFIGAFITFLIVTIVIFGLVKLNKRIGIE